MKIKSLCVKWVLRLTILSLLPLLIDSAIAEPLPLPVTDSAYHDNGQPPAAQIELGKLLFWDKILSGDQNISCGSCHHPLFGTGDGLSTGIGTGGSGFGPTRMPGTAPFRTVRNTLPLYNVGAKEFTTFLVDGAFSTKADGTFTTPFGAVLPTTVKTLLGAQALRPLTVAGEMTGFTGTNEITSLCSGNGFGCIWNGFIARLRNNPDYLSKFKAAFPDTVTNNPSSIKIAHVGNALAVYQTVAFRSDDSDFDKYLRGDSGAMSTQAIAGMELFYGSAGCSTCHKGVFQTDHAFHAIAMPQIGSANLTLVSRRDLGRSKASQITADLYKFKTPSLRNVDLTGPYGHDGAYATVEAVIRHHLDPVTSMNNYDKTQAILPDFPLDKRVKASDFFEYDDVTQRTFVGSKNELAANPLTDDEVNQLLAFMSALTGETVLDVEGLIPDTVPSGLPVAE